MSSPVKRISGGTPDQWMEKIMEEYRYASKKFGKFHNGHEGYAVIKEELDELWDLIKKNTGTVIFDSRTQQDEARQVAAMALRYLVDLC